MDRPVVIVAKPAGPLVIEGPVEIRDENGRPLLPPADKSATRIKLCACGRSRTKPFCDGSHRAARESNG